MTTLAAAWLLPEDWDEWCRIDPGFLQPSYQAWLQKMERIVASHTAQGRAVRKIEMRPAEFLAWSKLFAAGAVDSNARAQYAAAMLMSEKNRDRNH